MSQILQNSLVNFEQSMTSQWRRRFVELFRHFRPICDVSATSQILRNLLIIFYQHATFQRRRRFVEIYWSLISTNKWRCCNVTGRSKMTNVFRRICDVPATSQIRWHLSVIFGQSTTLQRPCRFVEICRRQMTKIRPLSDVVCSLGYDRIRRLSPFLWIEQYDLIKQNERHVYISLWIKLKSN